MMLIFHLSVTLRYFCLVLSPTLSPSRILINFIYGYPCLWIRQTRRNSQEKFVITQTACFAANNKYR